MDIILLIRIKIKYQLIIHIPADFHLLTGLQDKLALDQNLNHRRKIIFLETEIERPWTSVMKLQITRSGLNVG